MFNPKEHKEFYNWLLLKDLRPTTARRHVLNLRHLLSQINLTADELTPHLASMKEAGYRHSYINQVIGTSRVYTRFLIYKGQENDLGILELKQLGDQSFQKATLSDSEIESFLNLPPALTHYKIKKDGTKVWYCNYPKLYYRWTVFFTICAYSGMRMGEVAKLDIDHVDFGRNVYILEETKTLPRVVPIAPNVLPLLTEYMATLKGKQLFEGVDNVDWHYNFHQRIKRMGIKRINLTPYSLRHSFITALLSEDVNLFKVQKIVGHRRIDTTARYTHLVTSDMQKAMIKHPLILKQTDPRTMIKAIKEYIEGFDFGSNPRIKQLLSVDGDSLELKIEIVK